tara:strand:- start:370 stop:501 length:132 start_codon:yes stop_codon:yes gene_type:complete
MLIQQKPTSRLTINHFLSTSPQLISSSQEIKKDILVGKYSKKG